MDSLVRIWVLKDLGVNGINLLEMGIGLKIGGMVVAKLSRRTINARFYCPVKDP